jgi:tryptophanyl-tRNA synthetase
MIADLHALTSVRDPKILRQNIIDGVKDYLAAGVNPDEAIIFQQSKVLEHTELAWIFECLVTVPFLSQAHAYKDKVAKGMLQKHINSIPVRNTSNIFHTIRVEAPEEVLEEVPETLLLVLLRSRLQQRPSNAAVQSGHLRSHRSLSPSTY